MPTRCGPTRARKRGRIKLKRRRHGQLDLGLRAEVNDAQRLLEGG
jgi:hypothetical protein